MKYMSSVLELLSLNELNVRRENLLKQLQKVENQIIIVKKKNKEIKDVDYLDNNTLLDVNTLLDNNTVLDNTLLDVNTSLDNNTVLDNTLLDDNLNIKYIEEDSDIFNNINIEDIKYIENNDLLSSKIDIPIQKILVNIDEKKNKSIKIKISKKK
jgi:hypothetical protein